ncbi:MAG: DNA polymerase I [Planctomycetota bacterium]|nr:DNA polymerase I [Planctomycetota bacterium]
MAKRNKQAMLPGWESASEQPPAARPFETLPPSKPKSQTHAVAETPSPAAAVAASEEEAELDRELHEAIEQDSVLEPQALPDLRGKKVWLIDSMSLIFQVFHAIPAMTSPRGEPVNAVFGFTRDLFTILEQRKPDYLFCAFDLSGPTFRHTMYEAYKQHRSEMPPDLIPQLTAIRRVLAVLGVPAVDLEGYEADDVLATIARVVDEAGGECLIATADKDCRQLITDRVRLVNMRKNQIMDADALAADWGIRPDQVVDYQTLVGDPVDNVPGVPLIGPKGAKELLQKYDTLDNLYEHVGEITGKKQQNLIANREQAMMSRRLVRLDSYVPVAIPWEVGCCGQVDAAAALDLFTEFGFHSLSDKMRAQIVEKPVEWQVRYETIATPERLQWLVEQLSQQSAFSFDTETTSVAPRFAEIVGYSFGWIPGEAYYVPVRAPMGEPHLDPATALTALRGVLEDPAIGKIGQNLKYDIIVLRNYGVEVRGTLFDTMVASYLLDAGERNHSLDDLAARVLNYKTTKIESLIGTGKNQRRMDEVPVAQITQYAAEDADVALRLREPLAVQLEQSELTTLFTTLEAPLIETLVELEFNGIRIDVELLGRLSEVYGRRLVELEKEIHDLAGRPFNIGSPKQLQDILFVEQKLPIIKRTKTGASTDVDVLEELARLHPLPAKIIEYRQYAKLKSTYVDALPGLVHPVTGRIHASFNQTIAATGRLSSSDPNLQNIPIRTETGREIRSAFLPGHDGWSLLAADYSQIELRVLAHFSQDQAMRAAFERNEDIHARVASQVYSVPVDEVTSAQRRVAKAVNFGVVYGQSAFGLAKAIDISQAEAARFIDAYFAEYLGVTRLMGQILHDCRQQNYVTTILGRRRAITGVRDPGWNSELNIPTDNFSRGRNLAERTAINTVIQGSAADIIKLAMLSIDRRLRSEQRQAKMLLQIHDELVFEVPPEELTAVQNLVVEEMERAIELSVPLKVDVKAGKNWAECE